jgi:hypothetical protein
MEKTPKNSEKKKMINEQDRREQRFIKTDYHASNKKNRKIRIGWLNYFCEYYLGFSG